MPFKEGVFTRQLLEFGAFLGLTTYLQWASPNELCYRPEDGGRALMYVLAFGTALVVMQMQVGDLTKKEFSSYSSLPFTLTNVALALFAIGIQTPYRDLC